MFKLKIYPVAIFRDNYPGSLASSFNISGYAYDREFKSVMHYASYMQEVVNKLLLEGTGHKEFRMLTCNNGDVYADIDGSDILVAKDSPQFGCIMMPLDAINTYPRQTDDTHTDWLWCKEVEKKKQEKINDQANRIGIEFGEWLTNIHATPDMAINYKLPTDYLFKLFKEEKGYE